MNDLKYAFRHILRFKSYSLLNVLGLALGMASAILILLWIGHEVRTDRFHEKGKDLYIIRKMIDYAEGGISIDVAMTGMFAPVIEKEIPEVISAVRITWPHEILFRLGDKMFYEEGHYADSTFFKVFSFPLLLGDPDEVLKDPNAVVISEKLAEKYFGNENAVGKTIRIRGDREELFTVSGVFKDVPSYSTLQFDYIIPFSKWAEYKGQMIQWGNFHMLTVLLVQPDITIATLEAKLNEVYDKHGTWELPEFFVQPLDEYHLRERYENGKDHATGLIVYIRIFSIVALFIIILACMNYTNMATAIATRRGREVGIKKVFGSGRRFIFRQFTIEAIVLTFFAFILAVVMVELALPHFNTLINTQLRFGFNDRAIILIALAVPVITGLIAGRFPAMYISSFKPITVLKNGFNPRSGLPRLRQSLVVFQFVITIVFIISSFLIFKQIRYIQNKTLGLNEENIVYFPQSLLIQKHRETFKQNLERLEGVISVTYTSDTPLNVGSNTSDPAWRGKDAAFTLSVPYIQVDHDFCQTFDVDIIAGRNFSEAYSSDTNAVMINEHFAHIIGLDDPVGEVIDYWGRKASIVGVVKDFHIGTLHMPIRQLLIINRPGETWLTMVRIDGRMRKEALGDIEKAFREFDESVPFEYEFLDESYAENYDAEKYLSRLALLFTVLSIVISCLGLFGLALFTAEQRTKEIGIRKSIGAKTSEVVILLTRKFLGWVALSFVIASIIAFFAMSTWLEGFAYHTDINGWVFVLTGTIAVLIALVTVSWQAFRVASRNPVVSLRYE